MCVEGPLPQHIRDLIMAKDIEQIAAVLRAYEDAINKGRAEDCGKLYTQDGIVMPQNSPSCVGFADIRKTYESLFEAITFDVKFDIQEIVPVSPEYAFARSNSAGTAVVKDHGKGTESTQMLFVFRKVGGNQWKMARCCYSTTNPPPERGHVD